MKILCVPDVHGSHCWEKSKELINEVDKVIFLGDYVDAWENKHPDQLNNLKNIFKFKEENPDKVVILLGNHDFAYLTTNINGSNVSGHQYMKAFEIRKILTDNLYALDIAAEFDGYVFSHAGFSKTFVRDFEEFLKERNINKEFSVELLNERFHCRDPEDSRDFDEFLDWRGCFSSSGEETTQGPLWIRPNTLLTDIHFDKQVVGHTEGCIYGEAIKIIDDGNKLTIIDNAEHDILYVLDTENDEEYKTISEFNKLSKDVDFEISSIVKKHPTNVEEAYSIIEGEFTEKEKEYISKKVIMIMENTFLL